MRPARRSALRQPLDDVLGTVSTVRVLRELTLHGRPLNPSELAERASLSKTSVGKALEVLVRLQVVEPLGSGRYTSYRMRGQHFLSGVVEELFRREAARAEHVLERLRGISERSEPYPTAVWLYGSVARGEDVPTSDVDIVVVADHAGHREALSDHFNDALLQVADDWDITPSVVVATEEEIRRGVRTGAEFFVRLAEDAAWVWGRSPEPAQQSG